MRERQNRAAEVVMLRQKIFGLRAPTAPELLQLGDMAMTLGNTTAAIDAFEEARAQQGSAFRNDLELGVLYLSAGRLDDARRALDRVPPADPAYPMALFRRAQVSVLMDESDAAVRIQRARLKASAETRELLELERMFR